MLPQLRSTFSVHYCKHLSKLETGRFANALVNGCATGDLIRGEGTLVPRSNEGDDHKKK